MIVFIVVDRDSVRFHQGTELMKIRRRMDRLPVSAQFHLHADGERKKILFGTVAFFK